FKFLVVDDNEINRRVLTKLLENHIVYTARNGKEAVELFQKHQHESRTFDLIMMDIEMPVMNGLEATERIRILENESNLEKQHQVSILAITGNARSSEMDHILQQGIDEIIIKPINKSILFSALKKYLEFNPAFVDK
ncbi:kinase-regulated stress-responsive transcription factor skn7, partial [Physocladia obscura]